MPLIFSPLSEDILEGPFKPNPRSVFVMRQLGTNVDQGDNAMFQTVDDVLHEMEFKPFTAASQRRQKDFLDKIIHMIRGSGFGVAIFSEHTPAKTLANIFFEVGVCALLGKPTILVKTEQASAPSDFVRTEWVSCIGGDTDKLAEDLGDSVRSLIELADYFETLGDIASDADQLDPELAFERYKQAILIADSHSARAKLNDLRQRVTDIDFNAVPRARLKQALIQFCELLPQQ